MKRPVLESVFDKLLSEVEQLMEKVRSVKFVRSLTLEEREAKGNPFLAFTGSLILGTVIFYTLLRSREPLVIIAAFFGIIAVLLFFSGVLGAVVSGLLLSLFLVLAWSSGSLWEFVGVFLISFIGSIFLIAGLEYEEASE